MAQPHTVNKNIGGIGDAAHIVLLQDTKVVTVRVGSGADARSWIIHKKLLTHHSPYFAAAFGKSFREATTDSIDLSEDDVLAFELFVQWLYTGRLFMTWGENGGNYELNGKIIIQETPDFASVVWALGDKLACPAFQDHAMLLIVARFKDGLLDKETARLFYRISPPGSRLRQLAVDQFLWNIGHGWFDCTFWENTYGEESFHDIDIPEFTEDIAKRLIENRGVRPEPWEMGSRYLQVLNYEASNDDVLFDNGSEEE
ncbi:MAG: hypothetical protein Q9182_000054 [Xanthomendoza sp. 2 TL-2023]